MTRSDGRQNDQLRKILITREYIPHAEGSALIELGLTKVICTATVENSVPNWMKGTNKGWITAEYAMIPRSCRERVSREARSLRVGGRTHEIQRLIGRSLRSVTNLNNLPDKTIWIDCDVVVADGGTRVAAICGSFIALYDAIEKLIQEGSISANVIYDYVAAVSIGIVDGEILLDLDYSEDKKAQVDFNLVKSGQGKFIEVQGTAEEFPFDQDQLEEIIKMGNSGINSIIEIQQKIIGRDIYEEYKKTSNSQPEQG